MLKRILVPLDGSPLAEEAIGMAAAIARASNAHLDLLMVHEPILTGRRDDFTWSEKQIVAEQKYLLQIAGELATGAGVHAQETLLRGQPAELIVTRATDCDADLIVMTSHGRTGWSRVWLGSVADAVVRQSHVPVLILRPAEQRHDPRALRKPVKKILIPLDGSSTAAEVLGVVTDLARTWNARVDVLRVVAPVPLITPDIGMPFVYLANVTDSEATEALVREAAAELARDAESLRRGGISVGAQRVVVSPFTAQAIADNAQALEADLIAMSTHGRGASRLFIGSVADKVRRALEIPVLLHRPRIARHPVPPVSTQAVVEQLPALAGAAS